jgi:hypothetical protein
MDVDDGIWDDVLRVIAKLKYVPVGCRCNPKKSNQSASYGFPADVQTLTSET